MAALLLAERKVRTPQDKAPLKRRTPLLEGMASATESKHPNYIRKQVKGWCKRPPVLMETWAAR